MIANWAGNVRFEPRRMHGQRCSSSRVIYCRSRSEAAAFLIAEGVKARTDLFEKIADQTRLIRQAKERLKELLKDEELPRKKGDATVIIADAKHVQ